MITRIDPLFAHAPPLRPGAVGEGQPVAVSPSPDASAAAPSAGFGASLAAAVSEASAAGHVADARAAALAAGTHDDLHGTMIAGKQAEISLKLVGAIRNKLLDAFHELWRTSV